MLQSTLLSPSPLFVCTPPFSFCPQLYWSVLEQGTTAAIALFSMGARAYHQRLLYTSAVVHPSLVHVQVSFTEAGGDLPDCESKHAAV